MPDSLQPHGTIQSMEFSRPEYWSGEPFPSPGDLPNPGIKLRSPTLQADSLPAEPQGKPKNTEAGSLSFLQRIFPTQESNQGLLLCRRILYQLSYQGSPSSAPSCLLSYHPNHLLHDSYHLMKFSSSFICIILNCLFAPRERKAP